MINRILAAIALGLALGALLVMFTPWMRDFSRWNIDSGALAAGTALVFALCFIGVAPLRETLIVAGAAIVVGAAVDVFVLSLPGTLGIVPNPVAFSNSAQAIAAFTCLTASPFVAVGAVGGALVRNFLSRRWR